VRIIAGKFKSRALVAPKSDNTRPTTDRARESLFNVLNNLIDFEGVRVLDLFAGSGALAFESLSRGAKSATLVERDKKAIEAAKQNASALEVTIAIEPIDVYKFLQSPFSQPYDLVLADAPYEDARAREELATLVVDNTWLKRGGICVIEHRTGDTVIVPPTAKTLRELKAGEASFTILERPRLDE
jgi:16S rRNA (guanine966-N2)-methyltransferase